MQPEPRLPLGIDHKTYIRTLAGDERLASWKEFTDTFWNSPENRSAERTEFLFRRGFLRDKWRAYRLEANDAELFISDFQAMRIIQANGIYANVLRDRMLLFHALSHYCRVPEIHAMRGLDANEVSFSAAWQLHRNATFGQSGLPELGVVVQPLVAGPRGRIARASIRAGGFNGFGKEGDMAQLSNIVRDWSKAARVPYLFSQYLEQGAFTAEIYPSTQNRLSVVLLRHLDSWDSSIVSATLVFGAKGVGDSMTLTDGALSAAVDLDNGRLSDAVGLDKDGRPVRHERHPDTGAPIKGRTLPGWDRILRTLDRIMSESTFIRVAMLDFVLLDDGELGLIGPSQMDLTAVQVHRPLLTDAAFVQIARKLIL